MASEKDRESDRETGPDADHRRLDWHALSIPVDLPEVVDQISYERVVMNAAATWDYFPGHFDPEYAKRQGHPTIFVNTMHLAGFVDRVVTDWAGPYSRVVRRKIALMGSIYAGDTMIGRGVVIAKRCNTSGSKPQYLVDLEIGVSNQHGELCCPAEVTLEVLEP
jgi:acyl dehydratase